MLWRAKNPPAPPPPWTPAELAELDQMRNILNRLVYGQTHDVDLIFEFLRFSRLFDGSSMRVVELRRKAEHYRTLQQFAAKEKLWEKMASLLYSLQMELDNLRSRRERGGASVQ